MKTPIRPMRMLMSNCTSSHPLPIHPPRHTPRPPLHRRRTRIPQRKLLQTPRIRRDRKRGRPAVDQERLGVQIREVVPGPMVVGVVRDARLAAEQGRLFLGLDPLGAREEPAGGDAVPDEGGVVGAAVEGGRDVGEAAVRVLPLPRLLQGGGLVTIRVKVRLEQALDLHGPRRARLVERGPVAVVDFEGVVGRGDHVEVEVEPDPVELGRVERRHVVVAAQQAELLGGPEAEAYGVPDGEVRQGLGDDEVGNDA